MSATGWAFGVVVVLAGAVVSRLLLDVANKELQGWLFDLPHTILRFAAWCVPLEFRRYVYEKDNLDAELAAIYSKYEKKPITALVKGLKFSLGHVIGLQRSARIMGARPWQADFKARFLRAGRDRGWGWSADDVYALCAAICLLGIVMSYARRIDNVPIIGQALWVAGPLCTLLLFGYRSWPAIIGLLYSSALRYNSPAIAVVVALAVVVSINFASLLLTRAGARRDSYGLLEYIQYLLRISILSSLLLVFVRVGLFSKLSGFPRVAVILNWLVSIGSFVIATPIGMFLAIAIFRLVPSNLTRSSFVPYLRSWQTPAASSGSFAK